MYEDPQASHQDKYRAGGCVNLLGSGLVAHIPTGKNGKKRKADDPLDDPSASKKKKATPKVTKGRLKGPVDLTKQCGVINDKGLPCSRSLTCKSHSMGAKRSVPDRPRDYDELLLEWNRANNPNFVEPVKRETKAEKKEKRDREKAEKKRLAAEAAAAAGESAAAVPGTAKKAEGGASKAKKKKAAAAANAASGTAAVSSQAAHKDSDDDDLAGADSDDEIESLIQAVHVGRSRGVVAQPLALPDDVSPWFVARRERLRNCHQHLTQAFNFPNAGGLGQSRPGLLAASGRLG
jgi:SAGA-associated factor 73